MDKNSKGSGSFPFDLKLLDMLKLGNLDYLQDYIRNMLAESAVPSAADFPEQDVPPQDQARQKHPAFNVFELHDYYVIRLSIPDYVDEKTVRAYARGCRVLLKGNGLPDLEIPLPEEVDSQNAEAVVKNRVLEIRIPKKNAARLEEIAVHYL